MAVRPFNILSLCSGIGGLDLGVEIAVPGARVVCHVEREAYAAAVLVARMADKAVGEAPIWDSLETFDGKPWRGVVHCITSGDPCQPWSHAGQRKGYDDDRCVFDDITRIISEVEPEFVFLENVSGAIDFRFDCRAVLSSMGYRVEAGLFSAAEVGAPHQRLRLFLLARLAHPGSDNGELEQTVVDEQERNEPRQSGEGGSMAHSSRELAYKHGGGCESIGSGRIRHDEPPRRDNADGCHTTMAHPTGERGGGAKRQLCEEERRQGRPLPREHRGSGGQLAHPRHAEHEGRSGCEGRSGGGYEPRREPSSQGSQLDIPLGIGHVHRRAGIEPAVGGVEAQRELEPGSGELAETGGARATTRNTEPLTGSEGYAGVADYTRLPLFPPGPSDIEAWRGVLERWPEVEPAVCRMADGLPDRLVYRNDRLRALGNAVVPLTSALAFRTLWGRLND